MLTKESLGGLESGLDIVAYDLMRLVLKELCVFSLYEFGCFLLFDGARCSQCSNIANAQSCGGK